jgi:hypothetical protein
MTPPPDKSPIAKRPPSARDRAIETAIFVVSLAVVIATLVALVVLDRPWEPRRALLAPTVSTVEAVGEGGALAVHVELQNRSLVSLEDVVLEVSVPDVPDAKVALTVSHLPAGARRKAVAVLHGVPASSKPETRILGYQHPD